ncbi:hypothetical protein P175DRAFT_0483157 [Aspergillus ochraceoroseus IBT 24754]|uniref:Enoyl reductase (ER) domain-containing protein n=1 Tax=Aspergillus ochraceoroseus IBT 24754 TaxID=1392256 RepID=A0A2T5LTI6_9EURO|nr:uncharacterized protein P175DRAFT_0483157 [Aspergillus ochraceoroseus IBT 24754]PTU19585.1 hypothetical protein P175DRAFT_0483157 [Aspergillus ochraceoroseus IBT 24754]
MSKAIFLSKVEGKPGKVYYPLSLQTLPQPTPQGTELLVRMTAAALNHRDVFLRQHLYPGVTFDVPMGADGVGTVVGAGPGVLNPERWQGKRVILNPGVGWKDSPDGPEDPTGYKIMGGTKFYNKGTLQDYITIEESELEEAPEHLSDAEAAALPLAGLTGWRALVSKAGEKNSSKGAAILITGIGGGVALSTLLFAVARGADVYVTSSSEEKLQKAIELGAKGGVNYKEDGWEKKLLGMLPGGKKNFDAIIDGAGGDSVEKSVKLLKTGGILSVYGMTVSPVMPFTMTAVLKNIDVRGSTMGSRKEFKDMVEFVKSHKIHPVVSRTVQAELSDVAALDGLFQDMKDSKQFGKLVFEFGKSSGTWISSQTSFFCPARHRVMDMDTEMAQHYGPGMSFYLSHINSARERADRKRSQLMVGRYCATLRELYSTNQMLHRKINQLCSDSLQLTRDMTKLNRHMGAFHGVILETCQADTLTRLIESIYEIHGWKFPGGLMLGEHVDLDRETLSRIYTEAAKDVKKEMVTKKAVGLSEKYHVALQRYDQVSAPKLVADYLPIYRATSLRGCVDCPPPKRQSFSNGMHICSMAGGKEVHPPRHVSILGATVSGVL